MALFTLRTAATMVRLSTMPGRVTTSMEAWATAAASSTISWLASP